MQNQIQEKEYANRTPQTVNGGKSSPNSSKIEMNFGTMKIVTNPNTAGTTKASETR